MQSSQARGGSAEGISDWLVKEKEKAWKRLEKQKVIIADFKIKIVYAE